MDAIMVADLDRFMFMNGMAVLGYKKVLLSMQKEMMIGLVRQ